MMRVSHANANAIKDNFRGTGSKSNVRFLDQNRKKWNTWEWFKLSFILEFSKLPVFYIFFSFPKWRETENWGHHDATQPFSRPFFRSLLPIYWWPSRHRRPRIEPRIPSFTPVSAECTLWKGKNERIERWKKLCEVKEEGHFPDDFFSNPPKSPLFQFPCVHLYVWPRLLFLTRNSTGDLRFKEDLCLHFSKVLRGEA